MKRIFIFFTLCCTTLGVLAQNKDVMEFRAKEAERRQKIAPYTDLINRGILVDLGLPSATLWYTKNAGGDYALYTYFQAMNQFGDNLPTISQICELLQQCVWVFEGKGFKAIGPNGNSIYFPMAGYRDCDGTFFNGEYSYYWSSTPESSPTFKAHSRGLKLFSGNTVYDPRASQMFNRRCMAFSIRLVKN